MQSVKIKNVVVCGFSPALRGMRNAMESWPKSDSEYGTGYDDFPYWYGKEELCPFDGPCDVPETPRIGPNDMALAKKLIRTGSGSERKFLRMIQVWMDITLPRCVWLELDTYKIATVKNSCSTMYRLGSRDLTVADFADNVIDEYTLNMLNGLATSMRAAKGKERVELLRAIKLRLPEGYLQKATLSMNYETLLRLYFERRNHRMVEWGGPGGICDWVRGLPYMKDFISAAEKENKSE